ncbi:2'-5' RNA ligase family protein [Limnovirga soli]|jgi:2'-5' RNA ligase|nr:2'-5' RNA ligase family protein [Limnovirga soli]
MENELLALPGYRVCDYMLVLPPNEALWTSIMEIKTAFGANYDCPAAQWAKPYITLVRFKQYEMMEPRIIRRLHSCGMTMAPFKIELNDFGSFPSHTIYLQITSKPAIMDAVAILRTAQSLLKIDNDNKPHFITEPYIAIARKLLPWQYEKAWLQYRHQHFSGRFIASKMLLLKRGENEKGYQTVMEIPFQQIPVLAKQGELYPPQ